MRHPIVAAHRGLSSEVPENTEEAFRQAVAAGFTALEMDLRTTHDGEVVALHDEGVDRTTDGSGRVAEMDYDELRRLDTGAGPVPRLDDLLKGLGAWPGLWMLEMKTAAAVAPSLELFAHHGLLHRALVVAMDPNALSTARQAEPDVPRGLIVLGPPDDEDHEAAKETECQWLSLDHAFSGEAEMRRATAAGFDVAAWTVNVDDDARDCIAMGATCIITDERAVLDGLR